MRLMGLVGASGSGKTTLITALLPLLRQSGLRVSTIKHAHHGFDLDRPGKDSYRHREAGAEEVMLVSGGRWALMSEAPEEDLDLAALTRRMAPVDLLLVEGFKLERIPKLEIHRPALGKPALYPHDPCITAIASDAALETCDRPVLPLSKPEAVAAFIRANAKALA